MIFAFRPMLTTFITNLADHEHELMHQEIAKLIKLGIVEPYSGSYVLIILSSWWTFSENR